MQRLTPAYTSDELTATAAEDRDVRLLSQHLLHEPNPPPNIPLYALPDQEYLEASVMPLLLRGMEELAKVRPPDPLTFLAAYLIGNNPQKSAVPVLNNVDGRRVPLMEIALKAAAGFEIDTSISVKNNGESNPLEDPV